ncbi:DNA adenine methylase [Rhizobacter fulvus]
MYFHPQSQACHPYLRWAGGKSRLLPQLLPHLPLRGRLVEPFVGAGSVFLAADYDNYLLADANPDLISVWVALQSRPAEFIAASQPYFDKKNWSEDAYLRIREEFNREVDRFERAARFLYLNKFSFNGLFRVNRSGAFNVPYGRPKTLPHFPFEALEAAAVKLRRCIFMNGGFEATLAETGFGDAVYCDPPYHSKSEAPSFTGYVAGGFGLSEHERLVISARQAVKRGATVLISNHDTAETRELYKGWELHDLQVRRSLSASGSARGMANELLAVLRP